MTAENKKPSILLVEDEENLHEALKLNLELEGYEITSAYDGSAALKAITDEYFDLIILDVMLPEIDGINVTETVRLQNNDVPILILSAKNTSADRVLGLKKGADDYLTKPFKYEELLKAIEVRLTKHDDLITEALKSHELDESNNNSKKCAGLRFQLSKISFSELRVLKELGRNLSSDQIAEQLYLSSKTVQNHRNNMARKLGFKGQNSLLEFAVICQNYELFN